MDDLEKRDSDILEYNRLNLVIFITFIVNLIGLGYNFLDKKEKYYQGESLEYAEITLEDTIKYIDGGLTGADRFTFKGKEHRCRFWITGGSLQVVQSDNQLMDELTKIKTGESLKVYFYRNYSKFLDDPEARLTVIALSKPKKVLIYAKQTRQADNAVTRWDLIGGAIFGVILTIWLTVDSFKKRKWW